MISADFTKPRRQFIMNALAISVDLPASGRRNVATAPILGDIRAFVSYRKPHGKRFEIIRLTGSTGLEVVLAANRSILARFVRARLRDDAALDDVLQELWLKVQTVDSGPIAEPLAYLYRMADNLVLDRKRAERRREARDHHWSELRANGSDLAADAEPSPERVVVARDYLRKVDARLALLPERTIYIFRAVRIDKRPQKELASELGISVSAVEKHLQRAFREIISVKEDLELDHSEPQPRIVEEVGHEAG